MTEKLCFNALISAEKLSKLDLLPPILYNSFEKRVAAFSFSDKALISGIS